MRLTPEHAADLAIHCTLACAFVGLVMAALAVKAVVEGY